MNEAVYAFSTPGRHALAALGARRLLAAFDFDGTLAPIAMRPDLVVTPPGSRAALERLRQVCQIAIISGRGRDDLRERLGVEVDYVLGNHGIEGLPGADRDVMAECRAVTRRWISQWRHAEEFSPLDPGVFIEDKRYTLSVHYRLARDAARAQRELPARIDALDPAPRVTTGKCVFNLMPSPSVDKGTALQRLLALTRAEAALYVGDDDTDEDVFALREPGLVTVRVGRSDQSRARLYLRAPSEIPRLVAAIIASAPARGASVSL